MKYTYSTKMAGLAPSAIREILKATAQPGVIPFAAGNPAPEAFPVEAVREITRQLLRERPVDCLQYGITEGYAPLRDSIRQDMQGDMRTFDEVIVTSGGQQVVDLATKALCNEGDVVVAESPSFIGALNTFRSYGARLRGVPLQSDGMNLARLEEILKTERRVRLIYTIPNFQNPSGVTMSLEKRQQLYALAKRYGVLVLEDNPYGALRYGTAKPLPNIKRFDEDGIVIYAGSFSKILAPGLRVGYSIAPAALTAKMTVGKQASDVHTPVFNQMIVDEWLRHYHPAEHIAHIQTLYQAKRDLMCNGLAATPLRFAVPEGGLFLWCELPPEWDMLEFARQAVAKTVAVVPGVAFLAQEGERCNAVRLNFSTPTDEQLQTGVAILRAMF
jgi:2-aminoadipate transaminase